MKRLLPIILLLFLSGAAAQEPMRVFELQNRTADELVPVIEPLLGDGGTVTGTGGRLVVRADEETLDQIAEVLTELDAPPAQLVITVRQADERTRRREGGGVSGQIGGENGNRAAVRIYRNRGNDESRTTQQVRVIEGRWASVQVGREVPLGHRRTRRSDGVLTFEEGVTYRDVTRGFEVRARLAGDRVLLDLAPHSSRMSPEGGGRIDVQSATTTVSAPLGEWITVGGSSGKTQDEEQGITWSTEKAERNEYRLELKVERASR